MRLEDLIGQDRAITVLTNAILRGRVAHAYLFSGPEGVGMSTAAVLFAQALMCQQKNSRPSRSACGECRSCILVARGNHPDVRLLTPPDDRETSVIKIERIRREFIYDINLKPALGPFKIYLLDPADRTADLAIHSILKALEEPPPYIVTVLVTARPTLLPPTIHSRCQQVTFQLASTDAIQQHLQSLGLDPATASSISSLSGGRIAWAVRAAQRPDLLSARKAILDLCSNLPILTTRASLRLAEDIKLHALALAPPQDETRADSPAPEESGDTPDRPALRRDRQLRAELPWCLDLMTSWFRDLIAASQGAPLINPDYQQSLLHAQSEYSPAGTRHAIDTILRTKKSIQRNANIDLALESLAIGLLSGEE